MSARLGYYRRRSSRTRQHVVCIGIALAGIGAGIVGSVLAPWGFAQPPHSLDALQQPRPGMLLLSADGVDGAVVQADALRHVGPPALASGNVLFVRGQRHGRMPVAVECVSGGMIQIGAEPVVTWTPTGNTITDRIADAACVDHPMLRQPAGLTA